ncbi:MAG TPA: hypothetical protein VKV77_14125 [Methylovirgula sp.]|nr:hypothetical protein [Methylovirgula sp.]
MGSEKRIAFSRWYVRVVQRRLRRALLALAVALAFVVAPRSAVAEDDSLGAFLSAYRCPVTLRLAAIHARGDRKREDQRFLILALGQGETDYVQCEFFDKDRQMMCEAASGYYYAPKGAPRTVYLPADSVAALAKLGFSTDDSHGNFQRVMTTPSPSDFSTVADLLLSALYQSYGARLKSKIEVHSALVGDLGAVLKVTDCPPIS